MPSMLLPEEAYRRLRELAEARGLNVKDLILSLAVENAGPEEAGRIYWENNNLLVDRELGKLWRSAISMQVNFYEGWATLEAVRDALEDARELLEKLRCLGERQDRCS